MTEQEHKEELRQALVVKCGCLLIKGTTAITLCERHLAMLHEIRNLMSSFKQDLVVKIEVEHYEKDMFG